MPIVPSEVPTSIFRTHVFIYVPTILFWFGHWLIDPFGRISPTFGSASLAFSVPIHHLLVWFYLPTYHQLGTSISPFGSFLPQFWASRHFGRCSVIFYDIHISDAMYLHAFFHGDKAYSIFQGDEAYSIISRGPNLFNFSRGRSLFNSVSGTKPIQFFQGTLPIYFI